MSKDRVRHFEVHPSVVFQLGESLISDAVQALIELVKNSYDADATYAKVIVDTTGDKEVKGLSFPSSGGLIIVEDDGHGMDLGDIEEGWLVISNRHKRELKEAKKTTPGGRTPLGDKGLGRLGVQRLGMNLEIFTKSKGEQGFHFGFSWEDFATADKLENVDVKLENFDFPKAHGTKVVVSNLKEVENWRGKDSVKRLEEELSRMISPYKQIRDFMVYVEIDQKEIELREINERLRDFAQIRYFINFDGEKLSIKGRARIDFFCPNTMAEAEIFSKLVESDEGEALFEYISKQSLAKSLNLIRSKSKKWFVEFSEERPIDDLDKLERDENGKLFNPGMFSGEVESFDLGTVASKKQNIFDGQTEYREHVKSISGIRPYRDGFAIRVGNDWLGLGSQWTSARSYYGLKPDTTLGFIALSAKENINLEETTDREGFKSTPYFNNFLVILKEFVRFTNVGQEFLRRSWSEFEKKRTEDKARVDSRKTVEDISRSIKNGLSNAQDHQKALTGFQSQFEKSVKESYEVFENLEGKKEVTHSLEKNITSVVKSLESLVIQAKDVIPGISKYLEELGGLKDMGQVLEDRVQGIRHQMDEMYEAVALGLTAEALSHEIFNIVDRLSRRCKSIQSHLEKEKNVDKAILVFVEHVNSSTIALRKQVSFLSPALRYVREKREQIDLGVYLKEIQEFYQERLARNSIKISISKSSNEPVLLTLNRGKLTQVIDNFIQNSEYWLKEELDRKRIDSGVITFEISKSHLRIYDNGHGVDPLVEPVLFEPFVTAKKDGRGLGLFIIKQLLDSESCHVGVVQERNRYKRLFKFQVDFRGAIND